jgi:hypothetical protein
MLNALHGEIPDQKYLATYDNEATMKIVKIKRTHAEHR